MNSDQQTGPAPHQQPRSTPPRPLPRRQPQGIRIGRVLGFPVYLSASWLVLAVLVTLIYGQFVQESRPELPAAGAYAVGFGFVACLFVSVFLHELGHALTSRRFGIGVRGITLEMLGGYTEMERESPSPRIEAIVSLAGPAVSAVLGLAAGAAVPFLPHDSIPRELVIQLMVSNLLVAVFNALPGLPLDGGRALRAAIWAATGDQFRASRVAGWSGRVVAVASLAAGLLAFQYRWVGVLSVAFATMVALVLWVGASHAIRAGQLGARMGLLHSGRLARPAVVVPADTSIAEAMRRARAAAAGGVLVADSSGRPIAVVNEHAAAAVPAERQPWVPVDSVSRSLAEGMVLPAGLAGEDVVRAVQAHPATEYLVVAGDDGSQVVGVLRAADIAAMLDPKRTSR